MSPVNEESKSLEDEETRKLLKRFGLQWNVFANNDCIETTGWTEFHVPQLLPVLLDGLRSSTSSATVAIKSLSLEACSLGDQGIQQLCSEGVLPSLSLLVYLNLGGNGIHNAGAKALADSLHRLTMLQELKLDWNYIGDEGGVPIVQALPRTLRILDFSGWIVRNNRREVERDCQLGPRTSRALAQTLPRMRHLYRLVLDRQPLLPDGVVTLAEALPHCPSLRELSLQDIPVDTQGAMALGQVLAKCNLVVLHLNVNLIDATTAFYLGRSIVRCPSLRDVRLTQSRMGVGGLIAFEMTAAVHVDLERLDIYGHGGGRQGMPVVRQIERWIRLNRRTQRFLEDDKNHHLLPELWSYVARRGNASRVFQTIQQLPVPRQSTGEE
eukprot:scaffold5096_cov169-Amphora_coffeaeformis.AAC.4